MANGFISPLKKGTGCEPNRPGAAGTTVPRGACTLFPHARPNNFVTYVNGHLTDLGLAAGVMGAEIWGRAELAKQLVER